MKVQTKKCLILSLVFVFISNAHAVFGQIERKISEKLWVTASKNLTLLHILVVISPSGEEIKDDPNQSLVKEAREYFHDFKNHPAVQYSDQIFHQMWYFPFNFIAFYYSEFPEAELIREFPADYEIDENMKVMIKNYVAQVKDFYINSNFEQFWTRHGEEMASLMNDVQYNFPVTELPEMMEAFYGRQVERFYLVPCPFMTNSATHVEVEDNGKCQFYHLAGPGLYSEPFWNAYTAFHEFSHSFIEPVSRNYSKEIQKLSYLYEPLREPFQRMGYRDWDRAFNEHMVTAGQLHLTGMTFGEDENEKMLKREKDRGFMLIDKFYHYFKDFDANRDRYKNLTDYYPILLQDLATIKVDSFRTAGPMGFYPEYLTDKCSIKDVVAGSAFEQADIRKDDILLALKGIKITSQEKLNQAKEKYWNDAEEGNRIVVTILRNGNKISKDVSVPYVTKYKYVE